jgi:glutaminase
MLMYAYEHIKSNPQQATDIYARLCSVSVNAQDLAMMAATLANGGKEPGERQAGGEDRQRSRDSRCDGDGRSLRRLGQVAL